MTKKETKKVNNHEVEIKVEGKDWKDAIDKTFEEKRKNLTVDGFRKGKVPRNVFEKKFGKESLYMDAVDKVVNVAFVKALEESKLVPVVQPKVEITDIEEKGVTFKFTITTKPEVNVKKYKGLKIKKAEVEVTKEEIEHELGHILERYGEIKVKEEGNVEEGNIAVIDFEGFKDGVAFDGGKGENYELEIGSNTFIPGFEEQVIGMGKDEEKDINVSFPEEYPVEDLAGAPVVFKVKVNEIKEKVEREFDESLFEDLAMEGVDSKEKLEAEVEANIKAQKEMEAENSYVDEILDKVATNTEVDIPEEMVEEETNRLFGRFEEQMKMQGISMEVYLQLSGMPEENIKSQLEKEAYKNVLYRLMLEEIANIEKIEVTSEEADKEADELAAKYNMKKDEFLKMFGGVEMIQYDLEIRKVMELLKELNK